MAKLTDRQRKRIIAEYVDGDGKVSQRSLAKEYDKDGSKNVPKIKKLETLPQRHKEMVTVQKIVPKIKKNTI